MKRFWRTLEQASICDFVKRLPQREDSELGNNGIQLSGGQRQRLSIARELYEPKDILIMDEATSALDSETEKLIQENINSLKGEYTILIVAHRLSTIRDVDNIVFIDKGSIIDQGSYDYLMEHLPQFRKMVKLQEI